MSLGYPEQDAPPKLMQMPPEPVDSWLRWH
jgi:hypothetical protein